ncbi:MAG: hypothetical protein WBX01_08285 [Nitrososphaeraceae archaeon]
MGYPTSAVSLVGWLDDFAKHDPEPTKEVEGWEGGNITYSQIELTDTSGNNRTIV